MQKNLNPEKFQNLGMLLPKSLLIRPLIEDEKIADPDICEGPKVAKVWIGSVH